MGWAVAFSPDSTTLATASSDHTVQLWNSLLSPDKQIEEICNEAGRGLSKEEWSHYLPDHPYEQICQK